jgi:hypothetical protein
VFGNRPRDVSAGAPGEQQERGHERQTEWPQAGEAFRDDPCPEIPDYPEHGFLAAYPPNANAMQTLTNGMQTLMITHRRHEPVAR